MWSLLRQSLDTVCAQPDAFEQWLLSFPATYCFVRYREAANPIQQFMARWQMQVLHYDRVITLQVSPIIVTHYMLPPWLYRYLLLLSVRLYDNQGCALYAITRVELLGLLGVATGRVWQERLQAFVPAPIIQCDICHQLFPREQIITLDDTRQECIICYPYVEAILTLSEAYQSGQRDDFNSVTPYDAGEF